MKTLLPYQAEDAARLADDWLAGNRGMLLAIPPGGGKTLTMIRAGDMRGAKTVLVICPAVARPMWQREMIAESRQRRVVVRIESQADALAADTAEVVIVSWNLIVQKHVHARLMRRSWDLLIADEAHMAQHPHALRTRALYGENCDLKGGLASRARRVFAATGTPVTSGPHNLWPHMTALFPMTTKRPLSYGEWVQETCLTSPSLYGLKILGVRPDVAPKLRERLAPFVIRRRKEDILPQLPKLRVVDMPLGITVREQTDIAGEVHRLGVEDATLATAVDRGVALSEFNIASLSSLQRMLGVVKARPAAALVAMDLEGGVEKAVVFARHTAVCRSLAEDLARYGAVCLDGSTPPQARQDAIDRFQTDPECRVFVGQIDACSTAITLTAASDVYVVEPTWVPATNAQAIQRCHRIGQHRPVLARFLSAEGTVDELVSRALARKAETLEALGLEDR